MTKSPSKGLTNFQNISQKYQQASFSVTIQVPPKYLLF